jgi:hypothetical protein
MWAACLSRPLAGSPHEAVAQEIEVRTPKHLPFEHFEAIDMALDRTSGPLQRHPGFDRRIVLAEPMGKALEGLEGPRGGTLEPGIELCRLPLPHELNHVLCQVGRLGDLG